MIVKINKWIIHIIKTFIDKNSKIANFSKGIRKKSMINLTKKSKINLSLNKYAETIKNFWVHLFIDFFWAKSIKNASCQIKSFNK